MQNSLVEILIGAAVLGVAAVFLTFAYTSTGTGTVYGYEISAPFSRVDGITVGSDVRMSGIKIGTVSRLELDQRDYSAVAYLSISDDVGLPEDSSARITAEGLLGNQYVSIEPGGSLTMIEPGGRIEYTQGSVDLIGLLGRAMFGGTGSAGSAGSAGSVGGAGATP